MFSVRSAIESAPATEVAPRIARLAVRIEVDLKREA
jgi:hypothetical protein